MKQKAACLMILVGLLLAGTQPVQAASVPRPAVSSLSAVLYEPESGRVLYEKEADTRRPMASTTKLMTALVAAEYWHADDSVTVPETAVLVEGSAMGLRGGDVLTVRDLLAGLLLSSGNDAANALALLTDGSQEAFAARMNAKAAALGMTQTVFVTPSGLDAGEHGSTARDMARLGAAVLQQPLLADLCVAKQTTVTVSGRSATLKNHNRLLWLYEPAVGLKTGFTKKSGKCLVSAARRNGVVLIAVTLNGGDYWNDHIALYEYGFSQTECVTLPEPVLPSVAVCGGTQSAVLLAAPAKMSAVLLQGERAQVRCEWELPRFAWAPVAAGEELGRLRWTANGRVLAEVPLLAASSVEERSAVSFFEKWRRQWCRLWNELWR